MQSFVITGKAKQVFRLIALAAQREAAEAELQRILREDKLRKGGRNARDKENNQEPGR